MSLIIALVNLSSFPGFFFFGRWDLTRNWDAQLFRQNARAKFAKGCALFRDLAINGQLKTWRHLELKLFQLSSCLLWLLVLLYIWHGEHD